jgi:fermentation-respiration switch protein FrsA (DUF1100 family)
LVALASIVYYFQSTDATAGKANFSRSADDKIIVEGKYVREKVFIPCQNVMCAGYLYMPYGLKAGEKVPGIIMANALTAVKEITLPNYGQRFAEAGYAALAMDYRFWGESGGEPRNHILPYDQLQDIRDGITWLQNQPEVDSERVGGFGVSLGGSHMLYLATFDNRLDAIVAAVPGVNGISLFQGPAGEKTFRQILQSDLEDRQKRFEEGRKFTYKNAWGKLNDTNCIFCVEEAFNFYTNAQKTIAPEFENRVTMQSLNNLLEYNPDYAVHLAAPTAVLFIHATKDVIPIEIVREIYERTSEPKKFVEIDGLHTDIYDKEPYLTSASSEAIKWFDTYVKSQKAN